MTPSARRLQNSDPRESSAPFSSEAPPNPPFANGYARNIGPELTPGARVYRLSSQPSDAQQSGRSARQGGAGSPNAGATVRRAREIAQSREAARHTAGKSPGQKPAQPAPSAPARAAGPSPAPDRPSERSERDAVAGAGAAGAGAVAVLGNSNTNRVSPDDLARSQHGRRSLWTLRDGLRDIQHTRMQKCGHCRYQSTVTVAVAADGRASYRGLIRCGSVWACPVCRAQIQRERAKDVTAAALWHRANGGQVYMLTLTIKHGLGDDLKRIRTGVADAWKKMQQGKPWLAWKSRVGFAGSVRALEVTHGQAHGFHPHLHILLLARDVDAATLETWRQSLSARWQAAIERTLGREHVPNDHNGCNLGASNKDDYLTKLGLEIASTEAKVGRKGNRSPMQVAADFVESENARDGAIWRSYAKGMKGARMLTWSKGLRAEAGLGRELTDEEIVAEEERAAGSTICDIAPPTWREIVKRYNGPLMLLEAVESGGIANIRAWVRETFGIYRALISAPSKRGPP